MSIQRTHKQSDFEKRLKILDMQLHGKKEKLDVRGLKMDKEVRSSKLDSQTSNLQFPILSSPLREASNIQHPISKTDVTYLKTDLLKIFILSTIAIAAEFLLFFGSRYNFLRLL